jgi:hypothetical protein
MWYLIFNPGPVSTSLWLLPSDHTTLGIAITSYVGHFLPGREDIKAGFFKGPYFNPKLHLPPKFIFKIMFEVI